MPRCCTVTTGSSPACRTSPDDEWLADATECLFPEPDEIEADVTRLIGGSALFASRFRECASRALLLPRPRPGRRAPLWQQRQRSAQLLQIAAEHPTFPIVLEAVRECVKDVYDLPALVALMTSVQERRIRVIEVTPPAASPFARSLLFGYVSEYLYEGDSPLAERRAAALTLDPSLLGELLGQTDLRDLLEPDAIAQVVAQVQHLTEERRARGPEDAVDMLRSLGPLGTVAARLRGVDSDVARGARGAAAGPAHASRRQRRVGVRRGRSAPARRPGGAHPRGSRRRPPPTSGGSPRRPHLPLQPDTRSLHGRRRRRGTSASRRRWSRIACRSRALPEGSSRAGSCRTPPAHSGATPMSCA